MATIDDLTFRLSSYGTYYSVYTTNSSTISGALAIPAEYNGLPVTTIESGSFLDCTGLTSVTIPSSVTSIGSSPFGGCTGLTSITIESGNAVYHSDGNCCIETATNTLIFGLKNSVIPEYVTKIDYGAFHKCTGLTSITIPSSVTTISFYAFYKCTDLTSITIPSSVTSIGDSPFNSCTGLTSITIESGNAVYHSDRNCCIKTATNTLIFGCKNSVIPEYVTNIFFRAFLDCTGLTSITIPSSVTSIGRSAFSGCTGLTYFKFDGDAIEESNDVLYNTPNLECVHVNAGTTGWGETWGGKPVVVDGTLVNGVKFGDVEISAVYAGDVAISAIYAGETKIFG